MASKISIAEREQIKILTIHHGAYVKMINEINQEDYKNINTSTGKRYIEDVTVDYHNLIRLIESSDPNKNKLTLIEKCVCFMMSLKNNRTFHLSSAVKKNSKLNTINERMIIQAALYFLACSNYRIADKHGKAIASGHFDYSGFENGHKRELNAYKKELENILKEVKFDDIAILDILNRIYLHGVMYKEGIDLEFEEKIKEKLSCVELMENPVIDEALSPEYIEYKKRFRG